MADKLAVQPTDGKPSVFVFETQSGVIAWVTPIAIATLKAIELKAADMYPYPAPEPYQKPDKNSFVPDQMSPAEENPEYIADCQAVDRQRLQWRERAVFDYAVKFPKYLSKQALVDAFKPQLEELRKIAILDEDDYEAVLFHFVLKGGQTAQTSKGLAPISSEFADIFKLIVQSVPLTPAEVANGIRFFRSNVL